MPPLSGALPKNSFNTRGAWREAHPPKGHYRQSGVAIGPYIKAHLPELIMLATVLIGGRAALLYRLV
jgi:hypothetical protein